MVEGAFAKHVVALDLIAVPVFPEFLLCGRLEQQGGRVDTFKVKILWQVYRVLEISMAETVLLKALID